MSMLQAVAGGCPPETWGSVDPHTSVHEAQYRGQQWLWLSRVWLAAGLALTKVTPPVWRALGVLGSRVGVRTHGGGRADG